MRVRWLIWKLRAVSRRGSGEFVDVNGCGTRSGPECLTSYVNQHTTVVPHPHSHARTKMGSDRRFTRGRHLSRISPPRPARPQTRLGKPERKTEPPSTKAQPLVFGSPLRPSCPICAQRPSSTATAEPPGYEEGAKLPCYSLLSPTTLASTFRTRACRTRQLQLCVCDTVRGDSRGRVRP